MCSFIRGGAAREKPGNCIAAGGMSMGDKDFVKLLLERHAAVHFV